MEKFEKFDFKVKEITNKLLIGLDIGGTLTKLCIIIPKQELDIQKLLGSTQIYNSIELPSYYLYLRHFQTVDYKKEIMPILSDILKMIKISKIDATGGGAYKYNNIMKTEFNIEFIKHDELQSLIYGYQFMNKFNTFYEIVGDKSNPISPSELTFPHICVNIGSGVSFLKVVSPYKYERVGGTLMGGGTLIGFAKLVIGIDSYDQILELASKGNYENVDWTKNDFFLDGDNSVIASLGKIPDFIQTGNKDKLKKEDLALSLLNMICAQITQYSVLFAEKNNIDTIYYVGTFTKNESVINHTLNKDSKELNKNIKIRFNYYGGYLGTIGCLLEK